MPHQRVGGAFLAPRSFALLADSMGVGKSWTTIHGADLARCQKILVLCPAAVRPHWAREFAKRQQIDRPITLLTELPKTAPGPGVTIVSHDALARVPHVLAAGAPYDLIIVDECHSFREFSAARTRLLVAPGNMPNVIPPGAWTWAARFWGLTGTPIVNSAADLWPLFYGPMRCPVTYPQFCERFTHLRPTFDGDKPTGLKNPEELARMLAPHTLRRTLESVGIKLPSLSIGTVGVDLPAETMATILAGLEGWSPQRLINVLEQNSDLKDSNLMRVRRVLGLAKAYPVAYYTHKLLTEQKSGPVVVFFWHQDVKIALQKMLAEQCGFRVCVIDGKTTPKQLAATELAFQAGEFDVMLAQIQSAGQGITLHRSSQCVFSELAWTSTSLMQAAARVHRIGQTKPCTATIISANGLWLETIMAGIVTRKQKASETLLSLLTTAA